MTATTLNGHSAFDRLVELGVMNVNRAGKGRITCAPKDPRDFAEFVSLIAALGAWSVGSTPRHRITRETGRAGHPEEIVFTKHHKPKEA
jgi:hypothetical protein